MNCSNCGTLNNPNSQFCVKCGNSLNISQNLNVNINETQPMYQQPVQQVVQQPVQQVIQQPVQQPVQQPTYQQVIQQPVQQSVQIQPNVASNGNNVFITCLMYIIAILIKPFQTFKKEEDRLCNTKDSLILSSIIAGSMTVINLLKSMISVIFVKTLDYSTFQYKTTMDFSRLKNLDYVSLIGKNLLIYAGIIVAIALIYYLASLAFKKTVNFIKLLSISATSIIPFVVIGMLLSGILGKIWMPLSIIATVAGLVYSILIFLNLVDCDIVFENKDCKIYFHLICLSVLGMAGYYLYISLFMSRISGGLSDILNMFG